MEEKTIAEEPNANTEFEARQVFLYLRDYSQPRKRK